EDEPALEVELVGVLRVSDHVAAPEGIAPPPSGVRLDVGGGPTDAEVHSDPGARVELQPRASDSRELRVALRLARHAAHGEGDAAVTRDPGADHEIRPDFRLGISEVVGEVPVVVVDALVADLARRGSQELERGFLLAEEEADLDVGRGVEADVGAPGESALRLE